jgi:dinuclear metal center YbgI/SA1388 family protein
LFISVNSNRANYKIPCKEINRWNEKSSRRFRLCSLKKICFHHVMPKISLTAIVKHCDQLLRTKKIGDYDGAVNSLQVGNSGAVSRMAAAVDASLATVKLAIKAKADLMIVHHGLFWSPSHPWTGRKYELLQLLVANNLAIYSSHLPLDAHPRLGNNARLCAALGLRNLKPFFLTHGQTIGFKAQARISRAELAARFARAVGAEPRVIPGGKEICRRIGIVTGGAGGDLKQAADEGVDTFITGEGPHWTYAVAEELGLNVFYGGHYATETFGVKALAAHLSRRFKLPWTFIDYPTGL